MDLKHLADIKTLHEKTLAAARAEKAATFYLLECLHAIDSSKAYLELGHASLFDYVHYALSYSESHAYERIAAMRLAFKVTQVGDALKRGELSLTSVARIASHVRREGLTTAAVAELAASVAHCSAREVDRVLAAQAKVAVPPREVLKPVTSTTSTLLVTIDTEFEALLKEARELEADPTLSIAAILKLALKTRIEKKKESRDAIGVAKRAPAARAADTTTPVIKCKNQKTQILGRPDSRHAIHSRYIASAVRRKLWARSNGQCEARSPLTNARCNSRQSLQIDHDVPLAMAGPSTFENLSHLCAVHNRAKGMR